VDIPLSDIFNPKIFETKIVKNLPSWEAPTTTLKEIAGEKE